MALQDSFYIGFDWASERFALRAKWILEVFHHPPQGSSSNLLKVDELLVFAGQPYCLRSPEKLFILPESSRWDPHFPWVIVLKNMKKEHQDAVKGFGFRVESVTPPFEYWQEDPITPVGEVEYSGKRYQCLTLKELS